MSVEAIFFLEAEHRKRSWPAVSQICNLMVFEFDRVISFEANSTPIVDSMGPVGKVSVAKRARAHDFPV